MTRKALILANLSPKDTFCKWTLGVTGWSLLYFGFRRFLPQQDISCQRISLLHLERRTRAPCFLHTRTVQELERQRTNCEFCEKGDTWIDQSTPEGWTFPNPEVLGELIEEYKDCSNSERTVVIYKGGHVEKDLLMKLNIPCLNQKTLGFPKYDKLRHIIPQ